MEEQQKKKIPPRPFPPKPSIVPPTVVAVEEKKEMDEVSVSENQTRDKKEKVKNILFIGGGIFAFVAGLALLIVTIIL